MKTFEERYINNRQNGLNDKESFKSATINTIEDQAKQIKALEDKLEFVMKYTRPIEELYHDTGRAVFSRELNMKEFYNQQG